MKRKSCPNERQIGNRGQPLWILFGIAEAWNGFFYCAKRSAENEGRFEHWPDNPIPLGATDTLTLASIGFTAALRACYRTTVLADAP